MDPFTAARPVRAPQPSVEGESVRLDLGGDRMITIPRSLYALAVYAAPLERDAWETAAPQVFVTPYDTPGLR